MMPTARFSNKGFTLIEVLVALLILGVAMLGVLDAMVIALQHNLELYSRDESVRIAEEQMNELRNTPFAALANGNRVVQRTYKQCNRDFNVNWNVSQLSADSRCVQINVGWTVNRVAHNHSIASIISRGI